MNLLIDKLKHYYNLTESDYQELIKPVDDNSLLDASKIKGMDKVVSRINEAINSNEKIIVYGDYDCDGVTSTAIIKKTFDILNYKVATYLPSRYLDGYGLTLDNLTKIKEKGYSLIITVDNGITLFEEISEAKKNNIDVIVIDHHEIVDDKLPEAVGIIHPIASQISNIYGCGAYMSLFVSRALLGYYDHYLITLAGLATISDMMELADYNRVIVKLAIKYLSEDRYPPLIQLLDNEDIINEDSFGLEIAPKINAVGRMKEDHSINELVTYLLAIDNETISKLSYWIKGINNERKALTKQMESLDFSDYRDKAAIIAKLDIKEGLIGLVANRLLNIYNKPTIIFTVDTLNPEYLKGSGRSKEGLSINEFFNEYSHYFLFKGGHALAAGCTININDFDNLANDFNNFALSHPFIKRNEKSIEIGINEISEETLDAINLFSPFGQGFKAPLFRINDLPTKNLKFSRDKKHLLTNLTFTRKLIGFNLSEDHVKSYPYISIEGNIKESSYKKSKNINFIINKIE